MTSPLSIGFSTMCTASAPYSSGSPSRAGCGTCWPSDFCASSGSEPSSGVLNRPGAMVTTRIRLARQVAGDRQGHADDAALGRRVGGLADLAVERGDRRGVDDDAALLAERLGLGDPLGGQPQHVERADQVDLDDLLERVERERAVLAQRLDRVADARAVDVDAQRAERLGDVERLADRGLVGDVGGGELRAVAELAEPSSSPLRSMTDHAGAGVEQALGGRQAQAGRASGDDCYGVFDLH